MKHGFTLVEMIAVIVIVAIISIISIPTILNSIRNTKDELSDTMKEIIISSGQLHYSTNVKSYPKVEGNVYCVTLQTLIDEGHLTSPLVDAVTKVEIDVNKYVKATVFNNSYYYEISDECSVIDNSNKDS